MSAQIQPDFSIKLNGVQLLKKFGNQGFATIFPVLEIFKDTLFLITLTGRVTIVPYFTNKRLVNMRFENKQNYGILMNFLKFQLIESGVLSTLRDIKTKSYEGAVWSKTREKIDITAQNRFLIILEVSRSSITNNYFHNDNCLFNLITYYKPEGSVLGSNILFYDQRQAVLHSDMAQDGTYHPDNSGKLISLAQTEINTMYSEKDIKPVLLRGLYNSGDTLVINDMLLKHAVVSPNEIYEGNVMTIDVATSINRDEIETIQEQINVCPYQITPSGDHLRDRGSTRLSVVNLIPKIDDNGIIHQLGYGNDTENIRTTFQFEITPEEEMRAEPIHELNFDIKEYARFLKTLNDVESYNTCGGFIFVPSYHLNENDEVDAYNAAEESFFDNPENFVERLLEERKKIRVQKAKPLELKVTGGVKRTKYGQIKSKMNKKWSKKKRKRT